MSNVLGLAGLKGGPDERAAKCSSRWLRGVKDTRESAESSGAIEMQLARAFEQMEQRLVKRFDVSLSKTAPRAIGLPSEAATAFSTGGRTDLSEDDVQQLSDQQVLQMVRQTQAEQSHLLARQQRLLNCLAGRVAAGAQETSTSATSPEGPEPVEAEVAVLAKLQEQRTARSPSSNGHSPSHLQRDASPSRSQRDASDSGARGSVRRRRTINRGTKENEPNAEDVLEFISMPAASEEVANPPIEDVMKLAVQQDGAASFL